MSDDIQVYGFGLGPGLYNGHQFDPILDKCSKCGLTKEMCEDGYSCGRVQCKECTLLRQCIGERCEECYQAIKAASFQTTPTDWYKGEAKK